MIDLVTSLTKVIEQLKSRSRLSILDNWQRENKQGTWETLPTVSSKQNKPMVSFLQCEEDIHLRQAWQVPDSYAGLSIIGSTIRLNLIWWVDICEVWINGSKVQEGDLFDQKCRILLTDYAEPHEEFILEIKLNSPKHDIGALQLSELIFEYLRQPCDPDQLAIELEILQTYIPIFTRHQVDLLALETAANRLINLFAMSASITSESFFAHLAEIRKPLLQYSEFLKQRQIYMLGNSHIDVAWLWAIAETKDAMQRTFTSALNIQEQYPELIFNQSTAVSYQWMEREYPELFARIQSAVAEGKWEPIGGMWVEPDGNLPSGESLIRQILYGQEYFRGKFNKEVKIAWLPDTFGFHWQVPQILLKSGFEAFVTQKLMWNDTNKFPHQLFWWEGVDGSRIFTYFSNEIGLGLEPVAIAKYLATQEENHDIPETAWLYGVGDHGGGPTADMLDMGRKWADSPIFFEMQPSTLEDFLLNLKEKLPTDLPVWQDELYLEFHRGTFTSKAEQKRQNRQIEVLIGNAEKYSAIASLITNIPYPQTQLENAWQGLLLNQFHDILTGTSIPEVFTDADRTWTEAREICDRLFPRDIQENTNLQAWNFLNWSRSQLVEKPDGSFCWLANIPSFGFAEMESGGIVETNEPLSIISDSEKFYLENRYLKVEVELKMGAIGQIFDKRSQKAILQSPSTLKFFEDKGQYWDAWNIDPNYENKKLESTTLEAIEISSNSSLQVSVRTVQKFRNSTFIQEIQLLAFEPFITVKNWVEWQEEYTLVKVAFPVNWRSPYATYEIPMGTIQRSTLGETLESKAKWEVSAQYWADIAVSSIPESLLPPAAGANSGVGLSILNDSKYGYDAKPDCLRLTLLRSPNWPSPNSDRGHHEFTYRLVPHQGDWREANIVQLAQELNNPLVLQHSPIPNLLISNKRQSFLEVSAPNIILSAFKRSQDQSGWIMRFYEAHGQTTETEIEISLDLLQAENIWECDLMENKNTLLSTDKGESNHLKVTFKPYEIKTFFYSND
ncbi:alpha-mannosidase [Pseudanabaena sp. UWO311]|uniref:alpha-mannosidase n=1 Tax=Pseudanabaena sp. UWO311 TaxID=2487337 RepID=UPI0011588B9E|nr:glycoside hydrolase family 38 C-terminal domain-containing protein [Pseudanabaena sp. UWO311]TYQ25950.1 alpha-mannosidase [Pseudanabaena sp. UWO311]